jgi:hypothetical protein
MLPQTQQLWRLLLRPQAQQDFGKLKSLKSLAATMPGFSIKQNFNYV